MAIGFSFQPGADAQQMQDQPFGQRANTAAPQQAVQIRSLRVPKTLPSNAPVSRALLTALGSSAPGASGLTSLVQALRQVFEPQAPSGAPQMPPQQTAPTFPSKAPMPAPGPQFDGMVDTPPMQNAPPFDFNEGTDPTRDPSLAPVGRNQTLWSKYHDEDPINQYLWNNPTRDPFAGAANGNAPVDLGPGAPRFIVDNDPLAGGGRA